MDIRSVIRTIIAALVGLGLVVLVIVLISKAFSGHSTGPIRRVDVSKYADTSAASTLLMDGPTNLNQDHYQVRITVSGTSNEIDIIQGYEGNVIKTQSYPNNSAAYSSFLHALQLLGFSHGSSLKIDSSGYCPTGNRYTYSFNDGQSQLFSYWSTSCGGQGTFQGNPSGVRSLFERQIDSQDLDSLTSGTNVNL